MFKKICIRYALVIVGFVVAFIIFEMTVRLFGLAQQTTNLYESDPLIGSKHIPNSEGWWRKKEFRTELRFNSEGFRDVNR